MSAPTKPADPTIVNGINLDDLFALIDDVKREPAKGKTNWHVITTWQGQTRSRAEVESYEVGGEQVSRRFSIDIDEPREREFYQLVRDLETYVAALRPSGGSPSPK